MKRLLLILQNSGSIILFPFLMYAIFNVFFNPSCLVFPFIVNYLILIYLIFYFVLFQSEIISDLLNKKKEKKRFIQNMLLFVGFISMTFASFYLVIYDYDPNSFLNVCSGNYAEKYADFVFYSIGIFLGNNESDITANTFYSKLFVSTEVISSFATLVIILSNLRILQNPFNEHVAGNRNASQ